MLARLRCYFGSTNATERKTVIRNNGRSGDSGRRRRTSATCRQLALFILINYCWFINGSSAPSNSSPHQLSSTTPTPTKTTEMGQFSLEQRQLLRQAFMRKFGLEPLLANAASDGGNVVGCEGRNRNSRNCGQKLPQYIWTLYEKHSANPETDTIRHYASSTHVAEDGIVWMMFNLSATGRDPTKERIVRAELRLPEQITMGSVVHKVNALRAKPTEGGGIVIGGEPVDVANILKGHHEDQLILALMLPSSTVSLGKEQLDALALIVYVDNAAGTDEQQKSKVPKRRAKRWVSSSEGGSGTRQGTSASAASSANTSRQRKHRRHRKVGNSGAQHQHQHCRRTELYVDFGELNWQDWIMAPAGYEAYQCRGRCTHPMPSHLNTTNHAIVQSLIHSIDPSAVSSPSCVPVQMSAISILYKDVNNVIVVKTYADMRVDACGCH